MYFVYILKSTVTQEFYKGLTDNIDRRLSQHFSGKSPSTRSKLPLELIHVEMCLDRKEARKLEKYFKSGYGREALKEISSELKI